MGLLDFLKHKDAPHAPVDHVHRPISAEAIEAHRHAASPEEAAMEAELQREAFDRRALLGSLRQGMKRCLGVDFEPNDNPVQFKGHWFMEERENGEKDEAFWHLFYCFPCQKCGQPMKAVELECTSPYEDPPFGDELTEHQQRCKQKIGNFLSPIKSGQKQWVCPDCLSQPPQ